MMGLVCSYLGLLVCDYYGRLEWSKYCAECVLAGVNVAPCYGYFIRHIDTKM